MIKAEAFTLLQPAIASATLFYPAVNEAARFGEKNGAVERLINHL